MAALAALAQGDASSYAVTANVDHVVRLSRHPELRSLYTKADLVVADGMPLIWASRLLRRRLPERVAGSDLFPALSAEAARRGLSVFLLGGAPGTAERAAQVLRDRHPALRIVGTYCPDFGFEHDDVECQRIERTVRESGADILFVGLGSPKQELWIEAHRQACGAKLSVGIGISFSFTCGDVSRAPKWVQNAGLEWVHRLVQEPGRLWKRYLLKDVAFIPLVLKELFRRR